MSDLHKLILEAVITERQRQDEKIDEYGDIIDVLARKVEELSEDETI